VRSLVWDRENILAEAGAGGTVAAYTLAPAAYGQLVSQRRSGASSFHHYDALGSTAQLTGGDGAALAAYLYRAFGEQTLLSGSSPNPFTWVGRLGYYRQAADQYWVRARIVQAPLGRWLSVDPKWWGQGMSPLSGLPAGARYTYAGARPVTMVDPSGEDEYMCGPEIGDQLRATLDYAEAAFWVWLGGGQALGSVCPISPKVWAEAWASGRSFWDIDLQVETGLVHRFGRDIECPHSCPKTTCKFTVSVDGHCFSSYAVNYVLWGRMWRLCRSAWLYSGVGAPGYLLFYSYENMVKLMALHRLWVMGKVPTEGIDRAGEYWISRWAFLWADAGYFGGPSFQTPPEQWDKQACSLCPLDWREFDKSDHLGCSWFGISIPS